MHDSAMAFVEAHLIKYRDSQVSIIRNTTNDVVAWSGGTTLVEFGAQNVNGTIRDLPVLQTRYGLHYVGVDLEPGEGVDVVADAATVTVEQLGGSRADIVVCTNVLEHVETWSDIIANAHRILRPGGWFICQAAGRNFQVHSGRSESLTLEPDEYYGNVDEDELDRVMKAVGFANVRTHWREQWPHDVTTFGHAQ